jgi:hypothetical protein
MRKFLGAAFLLVFKMPALFGQAADRLPSFEVASIRAASPDRALGGSIGGGPGTPDPAFFRCVNANLQNILIYAYAGRHHAGKGWHSRSAARETQHRLDDGPRPPSHGRAGRAC